MASFKDWVSAFRLRTLPLSVSGIILGSCLAAYDGKFKWITFILAILTTISFQILSNIANDYGDGVKGTDNKERIGPERAIQSGKISPDQMLHAIRISILISIGLSFFLILSAFGINRIWYTLTFFGLGFLSIYAAINYTVGTNPYGYRGLGDIFVFVFFGLVSVIGCYVLYTKTIHHVVFLPAIVIGLLSVAVLNLNNMRDFESDRAAGKNTMVVGMGIKKAKRYHFFLIVSAMILSLAFGFLYYTSAFNFIFLFVFIALILHLERIKKVEDSSHFDKELKVIALSTLSLAILMGVGHLL